MRCSTTPHHNPHLTPRRYAQPGYCAMLRACPGLLDGGRVDPDLTFAKNIGWAGSPSAGGKPTFVLNFEQFLDALSTVAAARCVGWLGHWCMCL